MSTRRSLCLRFGPSVLPVIRARISYAFGVFAAVYGHPVLPDDSVTGGVCCYYGPASDIQEGSRFLNIPALYSPRSIERPTPNLATHSHAGEQFRLFFGVEPSTGHPDWLGEIFEWLSCSDEMRITERDSVGRIPYGGTLFARFGISPAEPHASRLMAWLESVAEDRTAGDPLPRAESPFAGCDHAIVCSHDLDYYFTSRRYALWRLLKNQLIAVLSRDPGFFRSSVLELWRFIGGRRFGDFLPAFGEAAAKEKLRATLFVIANAQHRRDGNSRLVEILPPIREALRKGFAVGIHGSYRSIVENANLEREVAALEELTGGRPIGGRQHWLRFDRHDKLFRSVMNAGLLYDSTLGFAETVGFRNGAAFPFPPYNFDKEEPYPFLEIPLAIMDTGLWRATSRSAAHASALAENVLNQSRRWGWGGVAVLWHNPLEAVGVSHEINRVFWEQLHQSSKHNERWMSAEDLLSGVIGRYKQAGFPIGEKRNAASAAA